MGICNIFSRVLTITAPYVAEVEPDTIAKVTFCAIILAALISSFSIIVEDKKPATDLVTDETKEMDEDGLQKIPTNASI